MSLYYYIKGRSPNHGLHTTAVRDMNKIDKHERGQWGHKEESQGHV